MLLRALSLAVAFVAFALPAAAAEDAEMPGSYILLIDKDGRPVAGTYRLGPGVQLVTESSDGGLPREAIYVDRAFFPQREASFLSFFNNRQLIPQTRPRCRWARKRASTIAKQSCRRSSRIRRRSAKGCSG